MVALQKKKEKKTPTRQKADAADAAAAGSNKRQRLPDSAEEYFKGDNIDVDPAVLKCAKILSLALIASITGGAGAAVYFYGLHYGTQAALAATWTKLQTDVAGCGEISSGIAKRGVKSLVNYFFGDGPSNLFKDCEQAWANVHNVQRLIGVYKTTLYSGYSHRCINRCCFMEVDLL